MLLYYQAIFLFNLATSTLEAEVKAIWFILTMQTMEQPGAESTTICVVIRTQVYKNFKIRCKIKLKLTNLFSLTLQKL